jgi:nitroreductase
MGGDTIQSEHPETIPQILRERRTIHQFTREAVPDDRLQSWIETAVWVPNHHLTQPWQFYVVKGSARDRLADLAGRLQAEKHADKPHVARIAEKAREEYLEPGAVVVVVQAGAGSKDPVGRDEDYAATCLATYNLILAAWADGFGSFWSTGRLSRASELRSILGIPEDDRVVAIVRLGRAKGIPPMQREEALPRIHWLS